MEGENVYYSEVDINDARFTELLQTSGVYVFPSVFLSVHGWGVWIETENPDSLSKTFKEWFDKMKHASETEQSPY